MSFQAACLSVGDNIRRNFTLKHAHVSAVLIQAACELGRCSCWCLIQVTLACTQLEHSGVLAVSALTLTAVAQETMLFCIGSHSVQAGVVGCTATCT